MALETKDVSIKTATGERAAQIVTLTGMRSMKLLTRLGKVVGPSLSSMIGGDTSKLGAAVTDLFSRLDEAEVEHLIRSLLFDTGSRIQTDAGMVEIKTVFDTEFAGDSGAVLHLVAKALEVNYGNFFGALAAIVPAGALAKASNLKGSSTSVGPSSA